MFHTGEFVSCSSLVRQSYHFVETIVVYIAISYPRGPIFYFLCHPQVGNPLIFTPKRTDMHDFLIHFHSGWRWVFLIMLVIALLNNLIKWRQGATHTESDQKWNLYAMSAAHLQLIVGFVLYFISTKVQFSGESMADPILRFFLVEHVLTMIVAVALITIGYSRGKRGANDTARFRLAFWYYLGGLIFILAGIPWPWQEYGAGWF